MATYDRAAKAAELVYDVAALHNGILNNIQRLMAIRTYYQGLSAPDQATLDDSVEDLGYDAAEIKTMITKWNTVNGTITAQALVKVEPPR